MKENKRDVGTRHITPYYLSRVDGLTCERQHILFIYINRMILVSSGSVAASVLSYRALLLHSKLIVDGSFIS